MIISLTGSMNLARKPYWEIARNLRGIFASTPPIPRAENCCSKVRETVRIAMEAREWRGAYQGWIEQEMNTVMELYLEANALARLRLYSGR